MKDDSFNRFLVRVSNAKKDGYGTIYLKDMIEVLRREVEFCGKGVILRAEQNNALSRVLSRYNYGLRSYRSKK